MLPCYALAHVMNSTLGQALPSCRRLSQALPVGEQTAMHPAGSCGNPLAAGPETALPHPLLVNWLLCASAVCHHLPPNLGSQEKLAFSSYEPSKHFFQA